MLYVTVTAWLRLQSPVVLESVYRLSVFATWMPRGLRVVHRVPVTDFISAVSPGRT